MTEWQARAAMGALVLLLASGVAGGLYMRGKRAANFDNVVAQSRSTEQSNEISRETADTVAEEQAETWRYAQADEDRINERIRAQPRPAGPADPDILRIARDAHARAVCSASRVQRAECSDDPAAAP